MKRKKTPDLRGHPVQKLDPHAPWRTTAFRRGTNSTTATINQPTWASTPATSRSC